MVKNTVDVYPANFMDVTEEEQRIHTLVMSIGSVGGLLSLFVFLDSALFGSRPSAVIGIVQKLAIGKMKRSIQNSQLDAFGFLGRPVPFVHPVDSKSNLLNSHQRRQHGLKAFKQHDTTTEHDHDTEDTKIIEHAMEENVLHDQVAELTRRLQLMELVFKNYCIDDQIFKDLQNAHHHKAESARNEGDVATIIKPGNNHGDNAFTRFFRRRRYARQRSLEDEEQLPQQP